MPKKIYRTRHLKNLVIRHTDKDGKTIEIVFRGGLHEDSTAKYTTSNEDIQAFLEGISAFGRDYFIESVEETAPVATEPVAAPVVEKVVEPVAPKVEEVKTLTDVKDVRRFKNLLEMRAAIKELGIEVDDNANYLQCKSIAAKEGYDFQIQR